MILTAGFYSCEKVNDNSDEIMGCRKLEKPDEVEANVVTKIEAKVENASKYSNVVEVKLMVYDLSIDDYIELVRSDWKDGGFTIDLPKTIDTNYLQVSAYNRGLLNPIADPSLNITISNKNVKAGTAYFGGIDKAGNVVTWFYPFKIDEDGNADEAFYSYVDSDVTISGYDETEAVQDFTVNEIRYLALIKTSTIYSVGLKKGWNVWCLSSIRCEQDFTITNMWSTTPNSVLKWYGFEDKWELLD